MSQANRFSSIAFFPVLSLALASSFAAAQPVQPGVLPEGMEITRISATDELMH
ncbi:MAG: hypothetical protein LBV29_08245 [Azoarcus sp.]|jgi:hypothetical protein|nr:hypothetical protein [Azoarcus sp.]